MIALENGRRLMKRRAGNWVGEEILVFMCILVERFACLDFGQAPHPVVVNTFF